MNAMFILLYYMVKYLQDVKRVEKYKFLKHKYIFKMTSIFFLIIFLISVNITFYRQNKYPIRDQQPLISLIFIDFSDVYNILICCWSPLKSNKCASGPVCIMVKLASFTHYLLGKLASIFYSYA